MNWKQRIASVTAGTLLSGLLLFSGGHAFASTYPILRYGSDGSSVVQLQQSLKTKGYFQGTATGYYGPITTNAVRNYQKDAGLSVDGIAGPQTLSSLYGSTASSGTSLLKWGSEGSAVTKLQNTLKTKGYFSGTATGYYGWFTTQAVKNFQRDAGIKVDGIAGPVTQSLLYRTTSSTSAANRGSVDRTSQENADIYWLARIIEAEAGGESYTGKLAVGNVIMNRVKSSQFANTVYGVIFEYDNGLPQFSPVADGTIYNNPSSDSYKAARETYYGLKKPVGDALFFFNPDKAVGSWIVNNRSYITTIGGHSFYA